LVNQWRLAKANRQMGMNDIQKAKDDLALNTMEAYVNVAYYSGTIRFATEKLEESQRNLSKARREEELGLKGKADVAQIEAIVAGDDYMLTRQQNLYRTAMLQLKDFMNFPYGEELRIDTAAVGIDFEMERESAAEIFDYARGANPEALQADFLSEAARLRYLMTKGQLMPSLSLSAGIYTSYFENLKSEASPTPFRTQFSNNQGEYVALSLRIPILDGFSALTNLRRARNSMKIANENRAETLRKLQTAIEQTLADRDGFAKESLQMEKKLRADEIAYRLTLRKFEEGLMSSIELQTSATILLESKANLLQRQLMFLLKNKQVEYYKGRPLID
ncbi:MAG: TolC family protein, partial [Tannerellaceae bacterium]|jgi:outer membrane protein|nr:TolC family protein [Tannerellaceae bacterium]